MKSGISGWVDPRSNPRPPVEHRPLASDGAEVEELLGLCQAGRVYAVEQWIADGRPIQADQHTRRGKPFAGSAVLIAVETSQWDLLRLLLCNGYQIARDSARPLEHALRARQGSVVDLLLEWGADPTAVEPDAVLGTYDADVIERFWSAGADYLTSDHLAYWLAHTSSNRPLYGWARKHSEDPGIKRALAMALVQAVFDSRDRAVYLTRWAGADPHLRVPLLEWHELGRADEDEDCYTAIEMATDGGRGRFLKAFAPDPARDDFESLWERVGDGDAVDTLVTIQPPKDWSLAILRNLSMITYRLGDWGDRSRQALLRIGYHGGCLLNADPKRLAHLRTDIVRMRDTTIQGWMLWWLGDPRRCAEEIYRELVRTPKMREILRHVRR